MISELERIQRLPTTKPSLRGHSFSDFTYRIPPYAFLGHRATPPGFTRPTHVFFFFERFPVDRACARAIIRAPMTTLRSAGNARKRAHRRGSPVQNVSWVGVSARHAVYAVGSLECAAHASSSPIPRGHSPLQCDKAEPSRLAALFPTVSARCLPYLPKATIYRAFPPRPDWEAVARGKRLMCTEFSIPFILLCSRP